jgi:ferritin-like metal-binding protein YciE
MHKITTLRDLYKMELSNLYNAEFRILRILPSMASKVYSSELKKILENHIEQTHQHVTRLEKVFRNIGMRPYRIKCALMEDLAVENSSIIKLETEPLIKDIAILSHLQKIEHYEIAGYGCAVIYAHQLGDIENQDILQAALDEEIETEEIFNRSS